MSQRAAGLPHPGESLRRAAIHLRLAFSLVLTPLFLWGVYLAQPAQLAWSHLLLAYLIVHIPLYGGMNAFNSYYDKDEGPIGALAEPPPVDRNVLYTALICKAAALTAGLWLDVRFGLLVCAAIIFSVIYSHPRWRWKERPALAALAVFAGGGASSLWGYSLTPWTSRTIAVLISALPPDRMPIVGAAGAALLTLGFYPLMGVYQIPIDEPRGVHTLAVALGVRSCFLFAAAVAPLGGLGVWLVMFVREAYLAMAASVLFMTGATLYIWRWYRRFGRCTPRQNHDTLMRLSYASGMFFTLIFLALILGS